MFTLSSMEQWNITFIFFTASEIERISLPSSATYFWVNLFCKHSETFLTIAYKYTDTKPLFPINCNKLRKFKLCFILYFPYPKRFYHDTFLKTTEYLFTCPINIYYNNFFTFFKVYKHSIWNVYNTSSELTFRPW